MGVGGVAQLSMELLIELMRRGNFAAGFFGFKAKCSQSGGSGLHCKRVRAQAANSQVGNAREHDLGPGQVLECSVVHRTDDDARGEYRESKNSVSVSEGDPRSLKTLGL